MSSLVLSYDPTFDGRGRNFVKWSENGVEYGVPNGRIVYKTLVGDPRFCMRRLNILPSDDIGAWTWSARLSFTYCSFQLFHNGYLSVTVTTGMADTLDCT